MEELQQLQGNGSTVKTCNTKVHIGVNGEGVGGPGCGGTSRSAEQGKGSLNGLR